MTSKRAPWIGGHGSSWLAMVALALFCGACDTSPGPVAPPVVGSIQGTVRIEGGPAPGVSVALSNGVSTTTDASGSYSFSEVPAGAYAVSIGGAPADATFPSTSKAATIVSTGQVVEVDFDGEYIRTSGVVGTVTIDGVRTAGLEVTLATAEGIASATSVTDAEGRYAFNGLRGLTHLLEVTGGVPEGVIFDPTVAEVALDVGETETVDFVGTSPAPVVSWIIVPSSISIAHVRGTSPCPQSGGVITLTNDGEASLSWTASPGNEALEVSNADGTLGPGASTTIETFFNCATTTSFSSTIALAAEAGGQALAEAVAVTVDIN